MPQSTGPPSPMKSCIDCIFFKKEIIQNTNPLKAFHNFKKTSLCEISLKSFEKSKKSKKIGCGMDINGSPLCSGKKKSQA